MRRSTPQLTVALVALLSCGLPGRVGAQARRPAAKPTSQPARTPAKRGPAAPAIPVVVVPRTTPSATTVVRAAQEARAPLVHHVSAESYVTSRYDDNVNRDVVGITSMGLIGGGTVRYASADARPSLQMEFDAAIHRYSATTRFNRISQRGRVTLSRRLVKPLTVTLLTEGSRGGSGEDRDVADQLLFLPQVDIRLNAAQRLRLAGVQRWRRFPTDSLQDATNQYALAELRHRWLDGGELEVEARLESNAARGDRFDFTRKTLSLAYSRPLGARIMVEAGLQYRRQRYSGRFTTVDSREVARVDHRLQPGAEVRTRFGDTEVLLSYDPEFRRSNDSEKNITQTLWQLGIRRRWY